jgi:hypothetical protein
MDYQECLDEIKVLAKDSREFVDRHFEIDWVLTIFNTLDLANWFYCTNFASDLTIKTL